jgi:hypothetical protein
VNRRSTLGGVFLALAATSNLSAQTTECRIGKPQEVAELMFGRNAGNRMAVSHAAWARFVDREITPRFPDGLTILDARGQWRDSGRKRIMREPSKLVEIVLPGKDEDLRYLGEIAAAYKSRFHQQSVGIIVRPACVAF